MKLLVMLHLFGVVIWVGGMFFAYMALRPAASALLDPPQRLLLWSATLQRFFGWVWVSVALVLGIRSIRPAVFSGCVSRGAD